MVTAIHPVRMAIKRLARCGLANLLPVLATTGRSPRAGVVPETVAGRRRGPLPSRVAGLRAMRAEGPGRLTLYGEGDATESGRNLKLALRNQYWDA